MKSCPICGHQYKTDLCPKCSFDHSRSYELHPTFSPLPGPQRSIAGQRADWSAGHQTQTTVTAAQDTKPTVNVLAIGLALVAVIIAAVLILMPKRGEIIFPDGTYNGQKIFGKAQGYGTMEYDNGDVYVGQWKSNKCHGEGTVTYSNGNTYEGQWENGNRHGQGICTYANGNVYEGQWVAGIRHGQGTMTYADGRIEEGRWKYGSFVG